MKDQRLVSNDIITRHSQLTLATLATYDDMDGLTAARITWLYLTLHHKIFGVLG